MERTRRQNVRGIHARFLRQNPRFVNAPIFNINYSFDADASVLECMRWHSTTDLNMSTSSNGKSSESFPLQTVKPTFHKAPKTIIQNLLTDPKDEGAVMHLKEHISFKHQYDCRKNPNEPIRGKLHGSFVCEI